MSSVNKFQSKKVAQINDTLAAILEAHKKMVEYHLKHARGEIPSQELKSAEEEFEHVLKIHLFRAYFARAFPTPKEHCWPHDDEHCSDDPIGASVCEGMYGEKEDEKLNLVEALRAVRALAGENPDVRKIVDDAIRENCIGE